MTLQTFTPPIPPKPGTSNRPRVSLREAEFGDGYTQATRRGLNHIRRVLSLSWEALTPDQASEILDFLTEHGGDTPFYYTPSDEDEPVKWTCKEWDDRRGDKGFREVSATFEQSFNLLS